MGESVSLYMKQVVVSLSEEGIRTRHFRLLGKGFAVMERNQEGRNAKNEVMRHGA